MGVGVSPAAFSEDFSCAQIWKYSESEIILPNKVPIDLLVLGGALGCPIACG